ncbi:MAG: hypothetical protein ABIL12_05950 [candidate division WOR-3 bacterium]
MALLKTLDVLGILEDFYTHPLYSGKGLWKELSEIIRNIKDNSLSGILTLSRLNEMIISFYDSGNFLEGISVEGEKTYSFNYEGFVKGLSASARVKSYDYNFYPHNSEVIAVVSLIHRSSKIMESITPYPTKVMDDLKDLRFSGILKIFSPKQASVVFLSGTSLIAFSRGKSLAIKEIITEGNIYEMSAFSVEGPLSERNYEYHFNNLLQRLNRVYKNLKKNDENLPIKIREIMIKYAEEEPFLDPILGFVELDGEIKINAPFYQSLRIISYLCDILMEAGKRFSEELEGIKRDLEDLL